MLFNSYVFIFVFLPITLSVFFILGRFHLTKLAVAWVTTCSIVFYGYWNPSYLPLLLVSMLTNYYLGQRISEAKSESRVAKSLLALGLLFNLGLIAYFKYANFLVSSLPISSIAEFLQRHLNTSEIILPLAISFFTFQQIAYLVDAYQGQTKEYSLIDYCLFVTFFPQLIAGPIVHHKEILPQFYRLRSFLFSHRNMALGLTMFTLGLSKKVLIADSLSPWVAQIFNNASSVNFIEAWFGALSYTFQLYFDFSGYSDMAIGLGLMMNISIPLNFNSPYKAVSISDFWRRWHITLSNFLRDYLYIPLGGNRRGELRRYINLLITMLLGGLWHGAGWTFVVWGGLHGIYLSIDHMWRKLHISWPRFLSWGITFLAVVIGWVIFRATNLNDAVELLQTLFGLNGVVLPGEAQGKLSFLTQFGIQLKSWKDITYLPEISGSKVLSLVMLTGLTLWVALLPNTNELLNNLRPNWWSAIWIGILASLCMLSLNRVSEFLYFQF